MVDLGTTQAQAKGLHQPDGGPGRGCCGQAPKHAIITPYRQGEQVVPLVGRDLHHRSCTTDRLHPLALVRPNLWLHLSQGRFTMALYGALHDKDGTTTTDRFLVPGSVVATSVTPTFYKNKIFVHIQVHIKCISNCSTYEKLSKNKSCIGCITWDGILYFSKILEEPRRI
jgi:hypothetical protein